MNIAEDVSLLDCNTLRLPAQARRLVRIATLDDLREALAFCRRDKLPSLLLGGGSNVVLRDWFAGCVLKMEIQGEEILHADNEFVDLRAAAGVPWHPFVMACHARGWHGLENLALIPGTVGAAPIQNIGAYGVEIREFIRSVSVLDRDTGECRELSADQCGFAYRHSRFKCEPALIVTALTLRLSRRAAPRTDYAALHEELRDVPAPTHADVLRAVIAIRRRRLPDPAELPNAGSFFKNPIVDAACFSALRERFPAIVHWPHHDRIKLAAAWLVDQCGWRGHREGDVGVHAHQALVLVNYGAAHAQHILRLAERIVQSVRERFGVDLEFEPQIY
jgi:UDP-N-acetylmuramate dehydrogenase